MSHAYNGKKGHVMGHVSSHGHVLIRARFRSCGTFPGSHTSKVKFVTSSSSGSLFAGEPPLGKFPPGRLPLDESLLGALLGGPPPGGPPSWDSYSQMSPPVGDTSSVLMLVCDNRCTILCCAP